MSEKPLRAAQKNREWGYPGKFMKRVSISIMDLLRCCVHYPNEYLSEDAR